MTAEEETRFHDAVMAERFWVNYWRSQSRLYMIELGKVNRACVRKVRTIQGLRQEIKWLKSVLNDLEQEMGREK